LRQRETRAPRLTSGAGRHEKLDYYLRSPRRCSSWCASFTVSVVGMGQRHPYEKERGATKGVQVDLVSGRTSKPRASAQPLRPGLPSSRPPARQAGLPRAGAVAKPGHTPSPNTANRTRPETVIGVIPTPLQCGRPRKQGSTIEMIRSGLTTCGFLPAHCSTMVVVGAHLAPRVAYAAGDSAR